MNEGDRPSTAGDVGPAWSATAELWDRHWARLADPAREVVLEQAAVGPGTRFLDMGCGTGELCARAAGRGATVAGIDAAEGMIERARTRLPEADLRVGAIESLPWDDGSFDVVAGFNSFQFAAERLDGFREARRVARRGGLVAVCVWGPREHNDLQGLFDVVRALGPPAEDEAEDDPAPAFGRPGVLEGLAGEAGLAALATGEVDVPYETTDVTELLGRSSSTLSTPELQTRSIAPRTARRSSGPRPNAGSRTAPTAFTTRFAGCWPRPERSSVDEQADDRHGADDHDEHAKRGR